MSRLQRHPWAMTTRFRNAIVLTYAFPETVLRPLVPRSLALEVRDGLGFVAVALVDMDGLRPLRLPRWTGSDAVFVGYRVFVRTRVTGGRLRRGLKVIRTDVNRLHLLLGTRLVTRYETGLVAVEWSRSGDTHRVRLRPRWRGAPLSVDVTHDAPPSPPPGSPFASWEQAAPFSGPLPWTLAPDASGTSAIAVKGIRSAWRPEPVSVRSHAVGFFQRPPFSGHRPLLASAFHVGDVDYRWTAGVEEPIASPQP